MAPECSSGRGTDAGDANTGEEAPQGEENETAEREGFRLIVVEIFVGSCVHFIHCLLLYDIFSCESEEAPVDDR